MNRVGASRLQAIANILGVPVAFFFEDILDNDARLESDSAGHPSPTVSDFLSSAEGLQLNRALVRITDQKVRHTIIEMVKSLADSLDRADQVQSGWQSGS